jgi:hypothetical protein
VLRNISGNVQQVNRVVTAEFLGEIEGMLADVFADAEYQALLAEARSDGQLVQGSVTDSYFQSVPWSPFDNVQAQFDKLATNGAKPLALSLSKGKGQGYRTGF